MNKTDTSRRRFLAGAAAVSGLALGSGLLSPLAAEAARPANKAGREAAENYQPMFFTDVEFAFLAAACDILIPSDDTGETGPGALELGVPAFIDRQMLTDYGTGGVWYMHAPYITESAPEFGYQYRFTPREIYRFGIEDTNAYCNQNHGRIFSECPKDMQTKCLLDIEKGVLEFRTVPASVFFSQLLANTKEGYFADPMYGGNRRMAAWKMIGFPGARGDYRQFVQQHNKPYTKAPVSIQRQEG